MPGTALTAQQTQLWALMQRIERCRHRAELAEQCARSGPDTFRREMIIVAEQWRLCADHFQLLNRTGRPAWF